MRLTDEERRAIRTAVEEVYGATAVVRLFGSRVHDHLRGGDIDLHVEADADGGRSEARRDRLWDRLQQDLGPQRIDIVESLRGLDPPPIARIAVRDGVRV